MKENRRSSNFYLLSFLLLFIASRPVAQPLAPNSLPRLDGDENVIHNVSYLEPFFERLYGVRNQQIRTVSIIHIGDSHIQADFLTEVVRKKLQQEFGNAGRGLIVPGRVAGTNEPSNMRSYSTLPWTSKRIVHPTEPLPIGIGGITINTELESNNFFVKMNDQSMDYSFNTVSVFYKKSPGSFGLSAIDTAQMEVARILNDDSAPDHFRLNLPGYYNHLGFRVHKENDQQRSATFFGLSFENGNQGILYHAIGVNGARFEHYNSTELFATQTSVLNPDLIIISLGTNESVDYPKVKKDLLRQITSLVQRLQDNNPEAKFILVTPPDAFIKKVKVNPGVEIVRSSIIQFAVENGMAFWDMYRVTGGKNSAHDWRLKGLLRPDGVHFTRDGYALQGQLLFEALMKGYNQYISVRHP